MVKWDIRKPIPALASIVFCALLAVVGKYLGDYGLLEFDPLEDRIGVDRRVIWSAKQAERQRPDIVLVTITEDTLRDYPFISPIPRAVLAELVNEIDAAGPKAIGLDIIVERRSPGDQDLIRAIAGARHPVVLGGLDDRYLDSSPGNGRLLREQLAVQEDFVRASGAAVGHLWLEHKTGIFNKDDETVRYVAASNIGHPARDSFSYALANAAGYHHRPASRTIAWLLPPKDPTTPLFAQIAVQRHKPGTLQSGSGLLSPAELELLKGRVVLVGADMTDRDRHKTPLFILGGQRTPGVEIHAQVVAQIADGDRDIRETPEWVKLLLYFAIGLVFFAASTFYNIHAHREVAAAAIALLAFMVLWVFSVDIPVGPIIFVSLVGVLVLPAVTLCVNVCTRIRDYMRGRRIWSAEG